MALADYVLPTKAVALPGGESFSVRGLSLEDITRLISAEEKSIRQFFDRYAKDGALDPQADPISAMAEVLGKAPQLAATIIAYGADEPEATGTIRKLPVAVQLEAMQAIADLTFEASGGPGKFVETVIGLMQGLGVGAVNQSLLKLGSQVSGDK